MASLIRAFDWRSLLETYRIVFGTSGADALTAKAEGDVLMGLGGDDTLESHFNRTALIGDRGRDVLMTDVNLIQAEGLNVVAI